MATKKETVVSSEVEFRWMTLNGGERCWFFKKGDMILGSGISSLMKFELLHAYLNARGVTTIEVSKMTKFPVHWRPGRDLE